LSVFSNNEKKEASSFSVGLKGSYQYCSEEVSVEESIYDGKVPR